MKNAIRSCAPQFSMQRMVKEYATTYYLPAAANTSRFTQDNYALAKALAGWKSQIRQRWSTIGLQAAIQGEPQTIVGEPLSVKAQVWLNGTPVESVAVEIVAGVQDRSGTLIDPQVVPMERSGEENGALLYQGALTPANSGMIALGVRVRPHHAGMVNPYEVGLSKWAE